MHTALYLTSSCSKCQDCPWQAAYKAVLHEFLSIFVTSQKAIYIMTQPVSDAQRTELEAAAFRRLIRHLREHTEVQNRDLMNLADFCRNCLSKWYLAAAQEQGVNMTDPQAREAIYGMPYDEWKQRYQSGPKQDHH
jgi:hypothetical protein